MSDFLFPWLWYGLALLVVAISILGSLVPVLPGLPFSFLALGLLAWKTPDLLSVSFLWSYSLLLLFVIVLDFFLPDYWMRKAGAGHRVVFFANLGMILGGVLLPPLGFLLGLFLGAFLSSYLPEKNVTLALQIAGFSMVGFFMSTTAKVMMGSLLFLHLLFLMIFG